MDFIRFFKRRQTLSVFLVSFAIAFIVFGNGIKGEFVLDDAVVVQNRGDLKDAGNFFNLFISPYHQNAAYTGLFRPLTMASYALNYAFLGRSPAGFHVVNISLHAINAVLVALLLLVLTRQRAFAYAIALIFLVHPLHTEAVTSIVGRAELLAFGFGIGAIILALRGRHRWSIVCFLLALISKESGLAVLPIILYLQRWHQHLAWPIILRKGLAYAMALIPYLLLRYAALGEYIFRSDIVTFVENPLAFASFGERIATACQVLVLSISKIFWPWRLSADYSYNSIPLVPHLFSSWQSMAGLFVLILFMGAVFKKRESIYGTGAILFLAPYLIISNLIIPIGTIMGERLMYFPSLGIIIMAGYALFQLIRWPRWRGLFIGVIVLIMAVVTLDRNRDWLSNERLLTSAAVVNPEAVISRTGLAAIHLSRKDLTGAREHLAIARHVYADYAPLQNLLGIVAVQEGDLEEAEQRYLKAIELNKRSIHAHRNIANLYLSQKKYEAALLHLREILALNPTAEVADMIKQIEQALP